MCKIFSKKRLVILLKKIYNDTIIENMIVGYGVQL